MSGSELVGAKRKGAPPRQRNGSSSGTPETLKGHGETLKGHPEKKILSKADFKTEVPNNAKELFTIWTDIGKDILKHGKRINKLIKSIDPKADEACIGVGSRASGILVYQPDGKVLLGLRNGELIVPGGKAQGEESPIEAAVREFKEEFLVTINERLILDYPQLSYYIVGGKYTIHLIPAKSMFQEPDKVLDEYKKIITDTLLLSHENPSELMWVDLYKYGGKFNNFTIDIKDCVGVSNFIKSL